MGSVLGGNKRTKGVFSDSNQTAQLLQMAECKGLEMMTGVILNQLQPKFAAKSAAYEMLTQFNNEGQITLK